mgnify:CR=1 FL=1
MQHITATNEFITVVYFRFLYQYFIFILIDIVNCIVYNKEKGGSQMATTPTQIRIDAGIKQEASALFSQLGLDMSSAVNMFLHQCVLRGGLPFAVEIPAYNQKTLDAMAEARRISRDPDVKGYSSMEDLKAALDD